jgi:hypothetical protein
MPESLDEILLCSRRLILKIVDKNSPGNIPSDGSQTIVPG